MLRSVAAYVFATVFVLLSTSAFRQALSELRDTEPGSLLFGVLQLVIGTSAVAAAVGLVKRARWASWPAAIWGVATAALLGVQPLYSPMDSDAAWSIWSSAAAIGVAGAGVSWFARRRASGDAASRASAGPARDPASAAGLLREGQRPAEPIIERAPDGYVPRGDGIPRREDASRAPGAPMQE